MTTDIFCKRAVMGALVFGLLTPFFAFAGEIQQHSIISVKDDEALVLSHTPSGDTEYRCSFTEGDCKKADNTDHSFFTPKINGSTLAEMSGMGTYGVTQQVVNFGTEPVVFYSFYDLTKNTPSFAGLVSVTGTVVKTIFSEDEQSYLIIENDGTVTIYSIKDKEKRTVTLDQTELPYFAVSEHAQYISTYNYLTTSHKIWNTRTNELITTPGEPSVIEFSENEQEAAYVASINGYRNLATIELGGSHEVTNVAKGDFLVEDYVYLNNTLYYLANKSHPLEWSLYSAESGNAVADDVSYNTYLVRYGDRIVYGKIDEKNTDIYTYDGEKHVRLNAVPVSKRVSGLSRTTQKFGGKTAAVIMPEKQKSGDLYIWLHGGPRRQTSIDYHPYLSYAVYDELLENIAVAGNYVVKLDYTGSWGYGEAFIEALSGNVGTVEINDVKLTIDAFKKEHKVRNVYLIGNSYGGYMAFRAQNALTNDVDGIISINGVADWYGLIQSIPSSPFKDLFGGVPSLATLPLYLSASAFTNFKDINGHTMLVVYGSEDTTVPPAQSKQYAEFMEANHKNVTLLELTGAEHTITRRENLKKLCEAVKDSFERKLACRQ